jgi:hypothetical protein
MKSFSLSNLWTNFLNPTFRFEYCFKEYWVVLPRFQFTPAYIAIGRLLFQVKGWTFASANPGRFGHSLSEHMKVVHGNVVFGTKIPEPAYFPEDREERDQFEKKTGIRCFQWGDTWYESPFDAQVLTDYPNILLPSGELLSWYMGEAGTLSVVEVIKGSVLVGQLLVKPASETVEVTA